MSVRTVFDAPTTIIELHLTTPSRAATAERGSIGRSPGTASRRTRSSTRASPRSRTSPRRARSCLALMQRADGGAQMSTVGVRSARRTLAGSASSSPWRCQQRAPSRGPSSAPRRSAQTRSSHPIGYTGRGGVLTVSVCIDPTSVNAAAMETPVRNMIHTWNLLVPTTPNLFFVRQQQHPESARSISSRRRCTSSATASGSRIPNLSTESGVPAADRELHEDDGRPRHGVRPRRRCGRHQGLGRRRPRRRRQPALVPHRQQQSR